MRIFGVLVATTLVAGMTIATPVQAQNQAPVQNAARITAGRFAIKEFQTADGLGASFFGISAIRISNAVADMLTTEMGNAGFDMLERMRLDDILGEQNLGASGRVNKTTAARTGDITGAQYLLVGTITEWGVKEQKAGLSGFVRGDIGRLGGRKSEARVAINYRVVDATTGKILTVGEAKGSQDNVGISVSDGWYRGGTFNETEWAQSQIGKATRKAVSGIAKQLKEKYPATKGAAKAVAMEAGIVSLIGTDTAIIDGGESLGLKTGDILEIVRFNEVKDKNGAVVYREETKIGTAQVQNVQASGAKIKITVTESGQKVEAGDTVRVRQK
ncbi:MAG: hypothetical protein H8F28_18550 [Fibrella sp.]|nr:hypothetical protein [Armatimonadota bacterium]